MQNNHHHQKNNCVSIHEHDDSNIGGLTSHSSGGGGEIIFGGCLRASSKVSMSIHIVTVPWAAALIGFHSDRISRGAFGSTDCKSLISLESSSSGRVNVAPSALCNGDVRQTVLHSGQNHLETYKYT